MPNITKCKGGSCGLKEECYRFTSIPAKEEQFYLFTTPFEVKNGKLHCIKFMKI